MAYQYRAAATRLFHIFTDELENIPQGIVFIDRYLLSERMFRIYPRKLQGSGIQIGTLERLDVMAHTICQLPVPVIIHLQGKCRDFQQGIGYWIKTTRFNIDNNRIVATKPGVHDFRTGLAAH